MVVAPAILPGQLVQPAPLPEGFVYSSDINERWLDAEELSALLP